MNDNLDVYYAYLARTQPAKRSGGIDYCAGEACSNRANRNRLWTSVDDSQLRVKLGDAAGDFTAVTCRAGYDDNRDSGSPRPCVA
ncbi:hypothetical protein [Micromonospora sp. CB01531]|uniref:hypothetical protein n=1 Tax=Micromonospora sp. CB01531 TaxID=1718947 RepID=UPI00116100A4|nr:hypothetical protein [Micromonospora sp. CB01531]